MRGAIHQLTIQRMEAGTPDDEGRGGAQVKLSVKVMGRVMVWKGYEYNRVGRFAEDVDAVAAVPIGTDVLAKDRVVVSGVDPTLDFTYEVMYVFYQPTNLELYLRIRGQ